MKNNLRQKRGFGGGLSCCYAYCWQLSYSHFLNLKNQNVAPDTRSISAIAHK